MNARAAVARGLEAPGAPPVRELDGAALAAAAAQDRVLVLLGTLLRSAGTLHLWPPEVVSAFSAAERAAAAVDCIRQIEMKAVVDALDSQRVRALTFKGAALAHLVYAAPHLRPRTDSDLLVPAGDAAALQATFARLGYERQRETSGRLVSYQHHYGRCDRHGVFHAFDVHVKISNRQSLADRLTFEELWPRRIPLRVFGPSASAPCLVDALLLALVHRAGHHPGSRDLLWIYDLHLLASALTTREHAEVVDLACARGLGQIACEGLRLAHETFGTEAARRIVEALGGRPAGRDAVKVIDAESSESRLLRLDLDALPTWRARGRLLREHLFPAPSYIRGKYGVESNLLLPALYAWRAVAGAPRWLRRRGGAAPR
jgi:putative nucleotidyltransferase-like protein